MNGKAGLLSDAVPGQFVCRVYETVCFALGSCTTGTANAVHVIFDLVREVVVNDQVAILDVQTARGDVSDNQQLGTIAAEAVESALARRGVQ